MLTALFLFVLWLRFLCPPGEEVLLGEEPQRSSRIPTFMEPMTPEEEEVPEMSGPRAPSWKNLLALAGPEDLPGPPRGAQEGEQTVPLGSLSNTQPWPHGDLEEPVCSVKLDRGNVWGQNHLEVMGLLTSYDSGFLKALSKSTWTEREQRTFGICPTADAPGLLASLQQVARRLASVEKSCFLLLHLEEVKWEAETKLSFKLTFQEDATAPLGPLQLALLIFYQGGKAWKGASPQERFLVGGSGLLQDQIVCLCQETQFLVLQGSVTSGRRSPGQLSFGVSLAIRHHSSKGKPEAGSSTGTGPGLSVHETQDLLFGFDPKCFTHMTPAVLLLAKAKTGHDTVPPSSFLEADGRLDVAPYLKSSAFPALDAAELPGAEAAATTDQSNASTNTGQFLKVLSEFVNKVLSSSGEPPPAARPHLRLDFERMEAFPHLVLNLSEKVALEQLVKSEDHLVVLFPKDRPALLEPYLSPSPLEGLLLENLLQRLRSMIRQLKAIPAFRANTALFQRLLGFCYYPEIFPNGDDLGRADDSDARGKIHSLLLLKALQTVHARWQDSRKTSSRANRSARNRGDYCRLRELTIDLRSMEYIIFPESYTANNCVGSCRGPLSTRIPDFYSHTLFLLHVLEQGLPLERAPCCVPVKYSQSLFFTFTSDQGMKIKVYPDMVAETCGCR